MVFICHRQDCNRALTIVSVAGTVHIRNVLLKCIGTVNPRKNSLGAVTLRTWMGGGSMRQRLIGAVLLCIALGIEGHAQVNSTIGGTVEDSSKALIPGVTIRATNTQTGVTNTTVSNESGAYNFPVLASGTYKLTAELPGFKPSTYNDVVLS